MGKAFSSHIWKEIKADFEKGMSQAEIRKKYNIAPSTLSSKIKRDGWVLSQEQSTALSSFMEASAKISKSFANANETQKKEIVERINTILEDNEIIQNNRKLAKAFQGKILNGLKNGLYDTPQNLKSGTGALKDLESIANPQNNKIEINNTNTQQNQINEIKRTIIKVK